jgi:hypothetical protein
MKRIALLAAILAFSGGSALAQAVVEMTPEQETTIYSTLSPGATVGVAPSGFEARVGIEVPASVELRAMPETVEVPAIRQYRYATIGGRVVLVDPGSRKVVRVIERR